jgi:virginiamycin B lyase
VVTNYTRVGLNRPMGIAPGPDGGLWFTNYFGNSIGRITTAGAFTLYTGLGVKEPLGIAAGPDGAMWFTNSMSNSIGRITTPT